jgi:hypothetical protein
VSTKNFAVIKFLAPERPDRTGVSCFVQRRKQPRCSVACPRNLLLAGVGRLDGNFHFSSRSKWQSGKVDLAVIFHSGDCFVRAHSYHTIMLTAAANHNRGQP